MQYASFDPSGTAPAGPARPGRTRPGTWRRTAVGLGLAAVALGATAAPAAAAQAGSGTRAAAAPSPAVAVSIPARHIPVTGLYIPPHVDGDREFAGHGPDILTRANLLGVGTNRLSVTIFMDAIETSGDHTRARGTSPEFTIYVAPAGQCIASVNRGTFEELQYRDTDHGVDVFPGQVVGSFVQQWRAVGDTDGDEAGKETGAAISTFTFTATVLPC